MVYAMALVLSYMLAVIAVRPIIVAENRQHIARLRSQFGRNGIPESMAHHGGRWSAIYVPVLLAGSLIGAVACALLWGLGWDELIAAYWSI